MRHIVVWFSIIIAAIGIAIIASGKTGQESLFGLMFGLISATGFSVFSVSLRWKKETPKFTTVSIAGLFCAVVSVAVIIINEGNFVSTSHNQGLFAIHGTLVCLGLILYSVGSKALPAAELTLLSLTETDEGDLGCSTYCFGI